MQQTGQRVTLSATARAVLGQVPAWMLQVLPVRLARRCVFSRLTAAAQAKPQPRQLLVDVSVLHQGDARTGIQRVVRALWLQLAQAPPSGYMVCPVFATRQHGYHYAAHEFLAQPAPTPGTGAASQPVQVQSGDLFLGLDLAAHLVHRHQAEVLRWKREGVNLHIVVYDLLPLQHPEWFNPKTTRHFKRWVRWLAVYADNAICISDTVKQDLRAWLGTSFGLPSSAIPASTIVLGADIEASAPSSGQPDKAEVLLTKLRNTPTVLMVGTLEPRKGYDQALAAFELLWQQPDAAPTLVLVGRGGWKTEALQEKLRTHTQVGKRLFWLDDASDEYLVRLYAACSGVLVASRAEGFGLPIIEAGLHGKSVLVRDLPVFREMNMNGVTYFDTETAPGLAAAITQWLPSASVALVKPPTSAFPTWQLAAAQLTQALGLTPSARPTPASGSSNSNRLRAPA